MEKNKSIDWESSSSYSEGEAFFIIVELLVLRNSFNQEAIASLRNFE